LALSTFASATITGSSNAQAGDTLVFITGVTYTFRVTIGSTANEVKIGGSVSQTLQNLADAINAEPSKSGITYGSGTVFNPEVRAFYTSPQTTLRIQSRVPGVVGNRISYSNVPGSRIVGAGSLSSGAGALDADLLGNVQTMQIPASILEVFMRILTGVEISP
jgi:hypothetical protein